MAKQAVKKPEQTLLQKCEIPIIDLESYGRSSRKPCSTSCTDTCSLKAVVRRVGPQLYKALSERGMAMLVNHGIAQEKLKAIYEDLDNFCALPESNRAQYQRDPVSNHGYVRPGMEQFDNSKKELRHSFNITSLSPKLLPAQEEVPGFLQHTTPLAKDFTNLSKLLLQALAFGLGLKPEALLECHSGIMACNGRNASTMRLLYYPPVPPDDEEACSRGHAPYTRCGAHADYGTFTLLAQDSEGGLEVKLHDSDTWQTVGHLPGAILIQPGQLLAAWTANLFPALMHRVVMPAGAFSRSRGRHCVAFFCHPDDDAINPYIPPPAQTALLPVVPRNHHLTVHDRLVNAAHFLQKRFRETYA